MSSKCQYVDISRIHSLQNKVSKIVLQATAQGTLFFILYTIIIKKFPKLKIVHYTDDSTDYDIRTDLETPTSYLNYELHKVDNWL